MGMLIVLWLMGVGIGLGIGADGMISEREAWGCAIAFLVFMVFAVKATSVDRLTRRVIG